MNKPYFQELAVCGFEAVKALASKHPEKISRLFFTKERARAFADVCKYLAAEKKLYRMVDTADELEKLSKSIHHQGVAAMIYQPVIPRIEHSEIDMWAKSKSFILVLDAVGNANNFGAIVRSAAFFGIKNIVISKDDRQAVITASAYRIAQGGMEFVDIYEASSTAWFLRQCRGKITAIGTDHNAHHKLKSLRNLISADEAVAIVLGNEENGMTEEAKKQCNHLVKIPGAGFVESLNVAQAGTLFLSEITAIRLSD